MGILQKLRVLSFFKTRWLQQRAEVDFVKAKHPPRAGKIFATFDSLREKYERYPAAKVGVQLSTLMGTTTSYDAVRSAMDAGFDGAYYLNNNPDVRAVAKDGYAHYALFGWKEGRSPNPFFDYAFYKSRNPELKKSEFPLAHFAETGKAAGIPTNPISDQYWFKPFIPTEAEWDALRPAKMEADTETVVVIPVYKGFEETMTAIYQAIASKGSDRYCIFVVNDNSPDEAICKVLQALADRGLFEYHASAVNRGFVQTCNFAINEFCRNHDIILLNSDAYVFHGWYARLRKHASEPNVATVTPLSNNATICSYPLAGRDNFLSLECTPQQLDAVASIVNRGLAVETPTGVGFCLYMRRDVITEIGALDAAAFEVGYGEENDFCMRALIHGYKNLIAGDVFVFHTGSVSFSAIKEENVRKGEDALERKHPNYISLVRAHVAADPERYLRRRLDLERLINSASGGTIFVSHRWGGGIETYLNTLREKFKANQMPYVTLTVHDGHRVTIDAHHRLFAPNLADIDLRSEFDLLAKAVSRLKPATFHVNSLAGLEWHWHSRLLKMIKDSGVPYTYICHDYSPISHHSSLLRPDNVYVPDPTIAERRAWSTMVEEGSIDACPPEERYEVYADFLADAATVEVPSQAARRLLKREFPLVDFKFVPHADHLPDLPSAQRLKLDNKIKIAIVGAIGVHKGSEVIAALAADAMIRNLELRYTIVGYSNNDERLRELGVSITGKYQSENEALDIISDLKPDLIFIPSICAETFCYSLSIAIKLKIPPVVFDIGAQAERVLPLKWGAIFPIRLAYSPYLLSNALLGLDVDRLWNNREEYIHLY